VEIDDPYASSDDEEEEEEEEGKVDDSDSWYTGVHGSGKLTAPYATTGADCASGREGYYTNMDPDQASSSLSGLEAGRGSLISTASSQDEDGYARMESATATDSTPDSAGGGGAGAGAVGHPPPTASLLSSEAKREAKRALLVGEMVATEHAYVIDLESMVEGYVKKMRPLEGQLFESGAIDTIFSNVEQLWSHQKEFIVRLEVLVAEQGAAGMPACFLEFAASFEIYSVFVLIFSLSLSAPPPPSLPSSSAR
jgi:hypothetical protein